MSCPICQRAAVPDYRPFCSRRCADIDLGNWLKGSYALPADTPEDFENNKEDAPSPEQKPH
ncbi:DNA gyrase inhibitor YacG [Seohaeicola saemankumensis]|nr:DNA gyrase inhibitor YacG [Seohaeicola saemankumensis]MCA0873711.1 DNA gyrase inhibitor YacG [Seohaeicola saemankumensis]